MIDIIVKVLLIMATLLAFIVPGFILRKTNLVRPESMPSLSNILLYLCAPMMIVKAFAVNPIEPSGGVLLNFLYVFLFSVGALLLTMLVCSLLFRVLKEEKRKRDVLTFIATFSNCGFVGLPFIDMFTDGNSEAMMYLTVFNVAFNIFMWTAGVYLITQDKTQISLKKAFLNPSSVASAIGLLLFCVPQINFLHMDAVKELQQIVVFTGNMTAPLSMMIVGIRLAELSPRQLFCDKKVYFAAFARLVLSFGLSYLLILPFKLTGLFSQSPYVLLAPVIAMAMPPAASIVALAEKYDGDKDLAASAYTTGTLLSVFTLPFVLLLISL